MKNTNSSDEYGGVLHAQTSLIKAHMPRLPRHGPAAVTTPWKITLGELEDVRPRID